MVTLIPIEPLSDKHGALIVAAFNNLFINRGGQSDGWGGGDGNGDGDGWGDGGGYGGGDGYGYGYGDGGGYGNGDGDGWGDKLPEEWRVPP